MLLRSVFLLLPGKPHRYAVRWNEVKILGKHTRRSIGKLDRRLGKTLWGEDLAVWKYLIFKGPFHGIEAQSWRFELGPQDLSFFCMWLVSYMGSCFYPWSYKSKWIQRTYIGTILVPISNLNDRNLVKASNSEMCRMVCLVPFMAVLGRGPWFSASRVLLGVSWNQCWYLTCPRAAFAYRQ